MSEVEFRDMAHGLCELLWVKNVSGDLGIDYKRPMNLPHDNKAAIEIAHNPVQYDHTKHVEIDHHFIMEKVIQFFLFSLKIN